MQVHTYSYIHVHICTYVYVLTYVCIHMYLINLITHTILLFTLEDHNMHVVVLLLPLLHYVHIITSTVYTVTPDDHYYPNTTCHHCHNLQHYLLNVTKYFTSNTQLLFLPGLHHLHTDLTIQNVHNISLIGSTANGTTLDIVIQCNSSVAILMTNITNLTLSDIS